MCLSGAEISRGPNDTNRAPTCFSGGAFSTQKQGGGLNVYAGLIGTA